MRVVLVAINSSFVQSNLAVRYLEKMLAQRGVESKILELTINDRHYNMLEKLYSQKGEIYCFSTYIWNVTMVLDLARDLKKVNTNIKIALGGPEATFRADELASLDYIDFVMRGEGEEQIYKTLFEGYKSDEISIVDNLDEIPFPYDEGHNYEGITYYESTRGCPYNCSYCLSSTIKGVRSLSVERVKRDITAMVNGGAKLIKFVDRTFNYDKKRAIELFDFLKNIEGEASFHFEMCATLIDDEMIEVLKNVPKEKFQFEIGVQSVNKKTLKEINRNFDTEILTNNIKKLFKLGNIHLHIDLIAGLPYDTFETFLQGINRVYNISDNLQLGFLKVLNGSQIWQNRGEYSLESSHLPPYEVFYNKWINFDEMLTLKNIEALIQMYKNSGSFNNSLNKIEGKYENPTDFLMELREYFLKNKLFDKPIARKNLYEILYNFCVQNGWGKEIEDDIRIDYILNENLKNPPFLFKDYGKDFRKKCNTYLKQNYNEKVVDNFKNKEFHLFGDRVLLFDKLEKTVVDITEKWTKLEAI